MSFIDTTICKIMSNPKVAKFAETKGISFFVETFTRLAAKKPVYWKIVQGAGFILYVWNNIPLWLTTNGIAVPTLFTVWQNKTAGIFGLAATILSQLAVASKVVGTDSTGAPIKQTDQTLMPFTAPIEANKVSEVGKANTELKQ